MTASEINELQRIFLSRLDTLEHLLDAAAQYLPDAEAALQHRLAPDMFPLGTQVAFVCNQPRGFAQWCAGQPVENLPTEVASLAQAKAHIHDTRALVSAIAVDRKLDETKRIGLGPGRYCELPARQYISEYLVPNVYFHLATTYAILRLLGVPLGKADYMTFLAPHVRHEGQA